MIENEDKKYVRYTATGKEFHMYSNAYDCVYENKDKPDTRFRSTQIYVESYDRDFYAKFCLNYSTLTVSLEYFQYAPKCNLSAYFFEGKDNLFVEYLAAAINILHREFPQFHTLEVRDELTLRTSEDSMRHSYLYLTYFIAAFNSGESWFEHHFKATPRHPSDGLEGREAFFQEKPELNELISRSFHIEYDWMAFMETYYYVCESKLTLREFIKLFENPQLFDTLAYWYPAYARSRYHIPYGLTIVLPLQYPQIDPPQITEISTTQPLISPLSDDYKYYGYCVTPNDDEILVINEGLSTMKFSMADIEDD